MEDGVGNTGGGGVSPRVLRPGDLRVYKVYDLGKQQVIALRIMEEPENVYKTSIAVAQERGVKITKRKDDELFLSAITRVDRRRCEGFQPAQGGSLLTLTWRRGRPQNRTAGYRESVLASARSLGPSATEEKDK